MKWFLKAKYLPMFFLSLSSYAGTACVTHYAARSNELQITRTNFQINSGESVDPQIPSPPNAVFMKAVDPIYGLMVIGNMMPNPQRNNVMSTVVYRGFRPSCWTSPFVIHSPYSQPLNPLGFRGETALSNGGSSGGVALTPIGLIGGVAEGPYGQHPVSIRITDLSQTSNVLNTTYVEYDKTVNGISYENHYAVGISRTHDYFVYENTNPTVRQLMRANRTTGVVEAIPMGTFGTAPSLEDIKAKATFNLYNGDVYLAENIPHPQGGPQTLQIYYLAEGSLTPQLMNISGIPTGVRWESIDGSIQYSKIQFSQKDRNLLRHTLALHQLIFDQALGRYRLSPAEIILNTNPSTGAYRVSNRNSFMEQLYTTRHDMRRMVTYGWSDRLMFTQLDNTPDQRLLFDDDIPKAPFPSSLASPIPLQPTTPNYTVYSPWFRECVAVNHSQEEVNPYFNATKVDRNHGVMLCTGKISSHHSVFKGLFKFQP